jgi:hypothetical protein
MEAMTMWPRRKNRIEIIHDKKANSFLVHSNGLKYWSSIPMGDIIVNIDRRGRIIGFEILNCDRIDIDIDEHERIMEFLEDEEEEDD